jgi:hypothetical protein
MLALFPDGEVRASTGADLTASVASPRAAAFGDLNGVAQSLDIHLYLQVGPAVQTTRWLGEQRREAQEGFVHGVDADSLLVEGIFRVGRRPEFRWQPTRLSRPARSGRDRVRTPLARAGRCGMGQIN